MPAPLDPIKREKWIEKIREYSQTEEIRIKKSNLMKGRKLSEETKRKISKSVLKNPNKYWLGKQREDMVGNKNPSKRLDVKEKISKKLKGRKCPWLELGLNPMNNPDVRKIISEKNSISIKEKWKNLEYRNKLSGENANSWKGGIAYEPYCVQWSDKEYKQSIKDRDENKCLNPCCNKKYRWLVIHHINYDKKDCRPTNLITVCDVCNTKANFNREWHQSWYNAIIYRRYYERR